jgi:hypothetical protein
MIDSERFGIKEIKNLQYGLQNTKIAIKRSHFKALQRLNQALGNQQPKKS